MMPIAAPAFSRSYPSPPPPHKHNFTTNGNLKSGLVPERLDPRFHHLLPNPLRERLRPLLVAPTLLRWRRKNIQDWRVGGHFARLSDGLTHWRREGCPRGCP